APLDPAWLQKVRDLPAREQYEAVTKELLRRNPGMTPPEVREFNAEAVDEDGRRVRSIEICSDQIEDLTPLQAFPALQTVYCTGKAPRSGRLKSLEPLREMSLVSLAVTNTQVEDLSPLRGTCYQFLNVQGTRVRDLAPLARVEQLDELKCDLTG